MFEFSLNRTFILPNVNFSVFSVSSSFYLQCCCFFFLVLVNFLLFILMIIPIIFYVYVSLVFTCTIVLY